MVFAFWGTGHITMNFSAYSELALFKWNYFRASVLAQSSDTLNLVPGSINLAPQEWSYVAFDDGEEDNRYPSLSGRNKARENMKISPVYPSDDRLYLPRIGKNVPLRTVPSHQNWQQLEENIQEGLQDGVVVHPISRPPTESGNFFVTGHSSYYTWDPGRFKDVFVLLHEVEENDIAEIYWKGKKYTYRLKKKFVVEPTEVGVLDQPEHHRMITLMTCTPIGTNKKRLLVTGELERVE